MADRVVNALAAGGDLRIIAASTTTLVEQARTIHHAGPVAATAFGELLTATAMMARTLKGAQRITLQIQANGVLGLLLTRADHSGVLYGTVANPEAHLANRADGRPDAGAAVGSGVMVVSRDDGAARGEPWVGYVAVEGGEIATEIQQYLETSEQLRSAVGLRVDLGEFGEVTAAGGFLAQLVGGLSERRVAELLPRLAELQRIGGDLVAAHDAESVARLVGGADTHILETFDLAYNCPIGRDYYVDRIASLGLVSIDDLFGDDGELEITCEFSRTTWRVARAEVEAIAGRRRNQRQAN